MSRLPPDPALALANSRQRLLERATLALGRLDSITLLLADPNIFLYAYIRHEAAASGLRSAWRLVGRRVDRFYIFTELPVRTSVAGRWCRPLQIKD